MLEVYFAESQEKEALKEAFGYKTIANDQNKLDFRYLFLNIFEG